MTEQETFDIVVNALIRQGRPSILICENGSCICAYRGESGRKCAIGHLIPDDRYDSKLELFRDLVDDLLFELGHDLALCSELQLAHDSAGSAESIHEWLERFIREAKDIADRRNLKWNPRLGHLEMPCT